MLAIKIHIILILLLSTPLSSLGENKYPKHIDNPIFTQSIINKNIDNLEILDSLIKKIESQRINQLFYQAYDNAWQALSLADKTKSYTHLKKVNENIGLLYSIFGQRKEAVLFLQKALEIHKKHYTPNGDLVSLYFNIVVVHNQFLNTSLADTYLDSCFTVAHTINADSVKLGYLHAEKAHIHLINKDYVKSQQILLRIVKQFENLPNIDKHKKDKAYLVILYNLLGDTYAWPGQHKEASIAYDKGLQILKKYNTHKVLEADLLFKKSKMFYALKNERLAYNILLDSKLIYDSLFSMKSTRNLELIKIRDKYQEDIINKDLLLSKQATELLTKQKQILIISTIAIILIVVVILMLLVKRIKTQGIKFKEQEESLSTKNKELASYSLQFIEKEKQLQDLAEYIRSNFPKSKHSSKVLKDIEKDRSAYWEEFNRRFIAVNQTFYSNLSEKHPDLTSTDLKHCALLKLNFSAKEAADIFGISAASVHTTRYRIRKKMNLDRNVNLVNYFASL